MFENRGLTVEPFVAFGKLLEIGLTDEMRKSTNVKLETFFKNTSEKPCSAFYAELLT